MFYLCLYYEWFSSLRWIILWEGESRLESIPPKDKLSNEI